MKIVQLCLHQFQDMAPKYSTLLLIHFEKTLVFRSHLFIDSCGICFMQQICRTCDPTGVLSMVCGSVQSVHVISLRRTGTFAGRKCAANSESFLQIVLDSTYPKSILSSLNVYASSWQSIISRIFEAVPSPNSCVWGPLWSRKEVGVWSQTAR
jgi:hypothetical protein